MIDSRLPERLSVARRARQQIVDSGFVFRYLFLPDYYLSVLSLSLSRSGSSFVFRIGFSREKFLLFSVKCSGIFM